MEALPFEALAIWRPKKTKIINEVRNESCEGEPSPHGMLHLHFYWLRDKVSAVLNRVLSPVFCVPMKDIGFGQKVSEHGMQSVIYCFPSVSFPLS